MPPLPGLLCGGGGGSEGGRDGGRGCISLGLASGEVLHKATFEADFRLVNPERGSKIFVFLKVYLARE